MNRNLRVCLIGNFPPRRCGIATFTADLADAIASQGAEVDVIAMDDGKGPYEYGPQVVHQIPDRDRSAYAKAANFINSKHYDLICIQHEFGIFGGPAGSWLLDLVKRLNPPIVLTLHTILTDPSVACRETLDSLLSFAEKAVVMTPKGAQILRDVHRISSEKVVVLPHGVPEFPTEDREALRAKFDFDDRETIMTFGLLAPDKGLQYMIEAMPEILAQNPTAQYVIVGQTHPHIRAAHGESYRESLDETAKRLGVDGAIRTIDRYVDLEELTELLVAADIYVTPYLKREQITSGTLAYAVGAGKAIVSTPYWHAEELLADGVGALTPARDSAALARTINELLADKELKSYREARAHGRGRTMRWTDVGAGYVDAFNEVVEESAHRLDAISIAGGAEKAPPALPELSLDHLIFLTDDVGIAQHATYDIPNRNEGYCTDDNARALILVSKLIGESNGPSFLDDLEARYLSFLHHAWNPEKGRFRNFMDYSRRWLEVAGSDDSNGRALWALGHTAVHGSNAGRRALAKELFFNNLDSAFDCEHLRSAAFAILGLDAILSGYPDESRAQEALTLLANKLLEYYEANATENWQWFERALTYDNPRLSQALLLASKRLGDARMRKAGCESLDWLTQIQTSPEGEFAPVGCCNTYRFGDAKPEFDQQPLEAAAQIDACMAAAATCDSLTWPREAERAMAWFLGGNVHHAQIAEVKTGACRDGLAEFGVNQNMGAESTLAYLSSLFAMRKIRSRAAETQSAWTVQ